MRVDFVSMCSLVCFHACGAIAGDRVTVFQSDFYRQFEIPPSDLPIGAHLIGRSNATFDSRDLGVCVRFVTKYLTQTSSIHDRINRILQLGEWCGSDIPACSFSSILEFNTMTPVNFNAFGSPRAIGSFSSWIVVDGSTGSPEIFRTHEWNHVCFSYDFSTKFVRFAVNGNFTNINHKDPRLENVKLPVDLLDKIYLGRCPWDHTDSCSKHNGKFTDFNLWDRPLTEQEMLDWTSCRKKTYGNVVDWRTSKWQTWNMKEVEGVSYDEICKSRVPGVTLFPDAKSFPVAERHCRKLKAVMTVIDSDAVMNETVSSFNSFKQMEDGVRSQFWGGWTDMWNEGTFENVITRESLPNSFDKFWYPGEPNGGEFENCGIIWPHLNAWNDESCLAQASFFCTLSAGPVLWMRGLPEDTKMDSKFSWTGELLNNTRKYTFQGYTDSVIYFDIKSSKWKLELSSNKSIYATTDTQDYPFGLHNWTYYNAPELPGNHTLLLSLTTCDDGEFNCDNGICIPMSKRCDRKLDCPDKSDEIKCEMIITDESYLKEVPPNPLDLDEDHAPTEKVLIGIHITVLEILDISEVDYLFSVQFALKLKWYDEALTFTNLKESFNLNLLTQDMFDKIWMPQVTFENTRDKEVTTHDKRAFGNVYRKGNLTKSEPHNLKNMHSFDGSANPIILNRIYSTDFNCLYQLRYYPFGTQNCHMDFSTRGSENENIRLSLEDDLENLEYKASRDLTQYLVTNFTIEYLDNSTYGTVRVNIEMKRRIIETIVTIYFPSFLICIICHLTVFFQEGLFKAVVTVNLTCLLCLVTIFISISDSLPKTSYVKMIGVWLFATICVPFVEVLLSTWIQALKAINKESVKASQAVFFNVRPIGAKNRSVHPQLPESKAEAKAETGKHFGMIAVLEKVSKTVLPIVFLAFTLVYWVIGLFIYLT